MEVNQIVLEGIKNLATKALNTNVGFYLGRAFVVIQANQVAIVAAIIIIAAVIFIAYKYCSKNPVTSANPSGAQPNQNGSNKPANDPSKPKNPPTQAQKVSEEEPIDFSFFYETKNIPTQTANVPNEAVNVPAEAVNIPSEAKNVPTEAQPENKTKSKFVDLTQSALLRKFQSSGIFENVNEDILENFSQSKMADKISEDELCKSTLKFGLNEKTEDFFKGPNRVLSDQVTNLVGDKLQGIYEASQKINKVLKFIENDGSRLATATFAALKGLGAFATGNFISGGLTLAIALKEYYNINNQAPNVDLESAFENIKENFVVISELGEQTRQAVNGIEIEISNARIKIQEADAVFGRIEKIINEGDQELVAQGKDILDLKEKALELNQNSISLFGKSQTAANEAQVLFNSCWQDIESLGFAATLNLNDKDAANKVKTFIDTADALKTKFQEAMKKFNQSQQLLNEGLLVSNEAYRHNIQLECKEQFILQLSKEIKEKINLELAHRNILNEATLNLDEAQNKVVLAEELLTRANEKIQNLKEDIQKVEVGVNALVDRNVIYAAFGGALGATFMSPIGVGFLALAAPTLIAIAPGFYIPKSDLKTNFDLPALKGEVKLGFYTQSTGLLSFWKEGSTTGGVVSIHMGKQVNHYHFNLNETDNGLNVGLIAQDLLNALSLKDLTNENCVSILKELEKPFGKTDNMVSSSHETFTELNKKIREI